VIGLLEIEFLQEVFAQGIERLQDCIAHQGTRLGVGRLRALARIEGLQRATHVVQRCVRIKPHQLAGLADVLIDRAHVIDRLGQLAEGGKIEFDSGLLKLGIGEQRRFGRDDIAPFLLQRIDEA
jgi:hypothetical protein